MSAPVAILDIGSNSVRFAILERGQEGAFFVPGGRKEICTTRLGKGLDKTGRLSPVPMADTVKACRSGLRLRHQRRPGRLEPAGAAGRVESRLS